jgi:hypothetical protein
MGGLPGNIPTVIEYVSRLDVLFVLIIWSVGLLILSSHLGLIKELLIALTTGSKISIITGVIFQL